MENSIANPLVSIVVITYNSAKFVLETLESAKDQTYQHIELIISDDGSTDNTVELCNDWLTENSNRFVRSQLITTPVNTGIPANCNRGVKAARGEWLKLIAGDDVLMDTCIEENVKYIRKNPEVKVLFSRSKKYNDEFTEENFVTDTYVSSDFFILNTAEKQYNRLLLGDVISTTPTSFIYMAELTEVGFFDERFKLIEDYPMWLKLTKNGSKFYFMDKFTVKHRVHEGATNNINSNDIIKPAYFRNENLRRVYVYPNLSYLEKNNMRFAYYGSSFLKGLGLLRKNRCNIFLYKMASKFLNPFHIALYIKRKIN